MTALWTSSDIAAATGGKAAGQWAVDGVSIDSRTVVEGDLFIALEGPRFDGHAFVGAARSQGAAAAMVAASADLSGQNIDDALIIAVDSTMAALTDLAAAGRARIDGRVVAVTGSVGKTTTKEALALVLGRQGRCHATLGNLNNHWGAPLTLARMPADTEYAVIELGMNHAGEIEPLSRLARPHVALITAVEAVHLEFFDSVAGIADAKAEIFAGLSAGGTAVIPGDNAYRDRLLAAARASGAEHIVTFGTERDCAYRLIAWSTTESGTRIAADVNGRRVVFDIGLSGKHMALNSLAVLAAIDALGADSEQAAADLTDMTAPRGRGARSVVAIPGGSIVLVDESYNASPASVGAMMSALATVPRTGRLIVALGDMLELGASATDLHRDVSVSVAAAGADLVFTAGPLMKHLHDALPSAQRGGHAATSTEIAAQVTAAVRPGDVVAVKGSFGSKMSVVVDALTHLSAETTDAAPSVVNGG